MVDEKVLFPILQFVALVAPAMAIFMQVLDPSGEGDSAAFRFLEVGLFLVTLGGSVILIQLLVQIGNTTTQFAIFMIFSSLIALAGGVAWKAIPITDEISVSVSTVGEFLHLLVQSVLRAVGFLLAFVPPIVVYLYGQGITSYLAVGGFSGVGGISVHILAVVVFLLMSIRISIYLISVGYINNYSVKELFIESAEATISGHAVLILLASIPFILSYIIVLILGPIVDLTVGHSIFGLSYTWTGICLMALYSIDLWAEEEDHLRLAANENA